MLNEEKIRRAVREIVSEAVKETYDELFKTDKDTQSSFFKKEAEKYTKKRQPEIKKVTRAIFNVLEKIKDEKTKLSLLHNTCYCDGFGTIVGIICGGLNGNGDWIDYFDDLGTFCEMVSKQGYKTWLCDIANDCMDDTFYAKFGFKSNEDWEKETWTPPKH